MTFGEWLKYRRRQLDLTQKELAEQAGCSVGTVRKIERDERRPSKQLAELLATELEIPDTQQAAFITFARMEAYTAVMPDTLAVLDEAAPTLPPLPGATAVAPQSSLSSAPIRHNLPPQPTPFLGREQETKSLTTYLADPNKRLITIVGPGGMGKTRLGLAVAEQQLRNDQFANGIYFVPLAPLSEAEQIIPTLAEALDFPLETEGWI